MATQLKIFIPFHEATTGQTVWLQNVDELNIVIDWGDDSEEEITNEEFVSHTYESAGSYDIFVYAENVWSDDEGNIIQAEIPGDDKYILIEAFEADIENAFIIRDVETYSLGALDGEFLNLSLPNTAIEVGSNEFGVVDNINAVLVALHENNEYLFEQTTILNPTTINTFLGWLSGGRGSTNEWFNEIPPFSDFFLTPSLTSHFSNLVGVKTYESDDASYLYLLASTQLKVLDGRSAYATQFAQTTALGFNAPFVDLSVFDVDSNNNLFLLDRNTLYKAKYDTINNRVSLIAQIGGIGSETDRYLFASPTDVMVDGQNRVYVVDGNNFCIKVYTNALVWEQNIESDEFTVDNKPVKICTDHTRQEIYVLTEGYDLLIFNEDGEYESTVSLIENANSSDLLTNIQASDINKIFADNNGNYLYAVNDDAVIKFTRSGRLVNNIQEPGAPAFDALTSGCIDTRGQIYITKADRVFLLSDPIESISLKRDDITPIALSAIKLDSSGHEFVQDWVYNKSIKRILRDLVILNGNIVDKVVTSFDLDGSLRSFFIRALEPNEKLNIYITPDNYIHANEFVLSDVVNRVFGKILTEQQNVLEVLTPSVIFNPIATAHTVLP